MKHKYQIAALWSCFLLFAGGCKAEVRERAYGEAMAVHSSERLTQGTIRYGESSAQASASQPALLPEALRLQSGKSLYTGHLSVLLVSGKATKTLLQLTAEQWLAPHCTLISTPKNAALLLAEQEAPEHAYQQACATGLVPKYQVSDLLGMLQNGAGIASIPCYEEGTFTLALWDDTTLLGNLSSAACRGAALAENDWEQFRFAADEEICTLTECDLLRSAEETANGLHLELECRARCTPSTDAAHAAVEEYLTAAMQESLQYGADLFFWQEIAIRDGIGWAAKATPEQWRSALQQAEFQISVSLS